jgi:hypothetical protein
VTALLRIDVFVDGEFDAAVLERRALDTLQELVLDLSPRHFSIYARSMGDDTPDWSVRWGPRR